MRRGGVGGIMGNATGRNAAECATSPARSAPLTTALESGIQCSWATAETDFSAPATEPTLGSSV